MKNTKLIDLFLYIKDLNSKGKYKEVVKYSNKYFEFNDNNMDCYKKVLFMKAKALRLLERFDECIDTLKSEYAKNDMFFVLELFFVYYYLHRYEEAFELLPSIYDYKEKGFKNYSISIMETVIKKHLGLPVYLKKEEFGYSTKIQIINYDERVAIEHIKSHRDENNEDINIRSSFNENVNIEYLMKCVKENLTCSKKLNINEIYEIYYFSTPNIGTRCNDNCNYLKVVVCPGTTNIITFYPTPYMEIGNAPILNCDFDKLFNKEKVYKKV